MFCHVLWHLWLLSWMPKSVWYWYLGTPSVWQLLSFFCVMAIMSSVSVTTILSFVFVMACHVALVWFLLFWINDLIKSHSINYVISWWDIFRSFVLYYFHSWIAWCCIVLIILVKFWMKLIMNNSIGISLIIACFIKCSVSWNLHFPDLHIIFATYWALAPSNYLSRLANWLVIPRV